MVYTLIGAVVVAVSLAFLFQRYALFIVLVFVVVIVVIGAIGISHFARGLKIVVRVMRRERNKSSR